MLSPVAAHLILGPREEPFLPALLASLADACTVLLVNDNSPDPSPHTRALSESRLGREGRIVVDRTPFSDFSAARNVCIRLHREHAPGAWMLFVDADEVHGPQLARITGHLPEIPPDVDYIDGYTWHFFQSVDWYRSIERAKMFIRLTPDATWEGIVHEKLQGVNGRRIALPYIFGHYGWVLPIERQAAKERLYASLGRPGKMLPQEELDAPELERSFRHEWRTLLRFRGAHPPAAREIVAQLRSLLHEQFAAVDRIVPRHQPPSQRLHNELMRLNYEQRWRLRALSPLARRVLS